MICNRSNAKKVSVYRKIDSQKPRERFQADTTVIPFMIAPSKQYLLNIKDHFSRFVWSFLIESLKSETVSKCLEILFKQGHVPTLFQTDNGSEFKKNTKAILKKYNIKHITSKPRCPQTQGMVENFNRYVKKYIILVFLTENRAHSEREN